MNSHDFNAGFGLQSQVNELVQYKELVSRCYDDIAALKKAHGEAVEFNTALAEENVTAHNRITALLARAKAAELKLATHQFALLQRDADLSTLRESMRWIPVSERLPEDCCDVLVRRENDVAVWTDIASLDNGWFDDIAHWMPLPKPPEDSSDE